MSEQSLIRAYFVGEAVEVVVADPLVLVIGVRHFLFFNPDRRPALTQIVADLCTRTTE